MLKGALGTKEHAWLNETKMRMIFKIKKTIHIFEEVCAKDHTPKMVKFSIKKDKIARISGQSPECSDCTYP